MDKKEVLKKQQHQELASICEKNGIDIEKMNLLVKNEKDKRLLRRRVSILKNIEVVITEESEK